ncbi:MAG: hypothetical protein Tsb0013_01980 [Phycisphaerales bacterium]
MCLVERGGKDPLGPVDVPRLHQRLTHAESELDRAKVRRAEERRRQFMRSHEHLDPAWVAFEPEPGTNELERLDVEGRASEAHRFDPAW